MLVQMARTYAICDDWWLESGQEWDREVVARAEHDVVDVELFVTVHKFYSRMLGIEEPDLWQCDSYGGFFRREDCFCAL